MGEETPGELVILVLHQDAHSARFCGLGLHVLLPDDRQEEWPSRVHDGDVGKQPAAVVLLEKLDCAQEERMLRHGAHRVVGYTGGNRTAHPRGIGEERVQATVAALLQLVSGTIFNARVHIHRPYRCRFHRSVQEQSIGSSLRAGWGIGSH